MKEDGAVVRSRVVRELERSVTLSDCDALRGQPHDANDTWNFSVDAGRRVEAGGREGAGEQDDRFLPRRVFLSQEVVRKFSPTPDSRKCRGAIAGDKAYQFKNHSEGLSTTHGTFGEGKSGATTLLRQSDNVLDIAQAICSRSNRWTCGKLVQNLVSCM